MRPAISFPAQEGLCHPPEGVHPRDPLQHSRRLCSTVMKMDWCPVCAGTVPGPHVCLYLIFGWPASSLLLPARSSRGEGGSSLLWRMGFSLRWRLLSPSAGSGCRGFRSCGTQASLPRGVWSLPGPGIKVPTESPALAGRFLTTGPPGSPVLDVLPPLLS